MSNGQYQTGIEMSSSIYDQLRSDLSKIYNPRIEGSKLIFKFENGFSGSIYNSSTDIPTLSLNLDRFYKLRILIK